MVKIKGFQMKTLKTTIREGKVCIASLYLNGMCIDSHVDYADGSIGN